jgi:hypothetical protein
MEQSDLIAKYDLYRKRAMALNNKLIQSCLDRDRLLRAAEQLGMVEGGKIVFSGEQESDVLMDFALNDFREGGMTAVERYAEKAGGADEIEKELIEGLLASYTSLFREASVSRESRTIELEDVLGGKGRVQIIDKGLSMSYAEHTLLFLRIVPLKAFNMTSGIFFAFPEGTKSRMLRAYENIYQRTPLDNDATRRFAAFFRTSRIFGKQGMFI